jgi:hypothetical protein
MRGVKTIGSPWRCQPTGETFTDGIFVHAWDGHGTLKEDAEPWGKLPTDGRKVV